MKNTVMWDDLSAFTKIALHSRSGATGEDWLILGRDDRGQWCLVRHVPLSDWLEGPFATDRGFREWAMEKEVYELMQSTSDYPEAETLIAREVSEIEGNPNRYPGPLDDLGDIPPTG